MISTTVVVPAYNAEKTLGDTLRALCGQDADRNTLECIVVDDGSRDATAQIAASFDIQLIRRRHGGAAAARNTGLAAARGEWVAFTDADCTPTRSWVSLLQSAIKSSETPEPAIGAAGKTIGLGVHPVARFCNLIGSLDASQYLLHPRFPFAPSSNLMYRRQVLENVGGFDERYTAYEACDLHCRIRTRYSGRFVYEPRAVVFHRHRADWNAYWRQQFWYGAGYAQFTLHHEDEVRWTTAEELCAWAEIVKYAMRAWLPLPNEASLYARGMFVKRLAHRIGFVKTRWSFREKAKWRASKAV